MIIQSDCEICAHKPVCSIIEDFKNAVSEIQDAKVTISAKQNSIMRKNVSDMPITVRIECQHYINKGKTIGNRMIHEGEKADAD